MLSISVKSQLSASQSNSRTFLSDNIEIENLKERGMSEYPNFIFMIKFLKYTAPRAIYLLNRKLQGSNQIHDKYLLADNVSKTH